MSEQHYFLSYSRDQLYFAENLATRLQAQDIPVWFDLQQLKPGIEWVDSIEDGLAHAKGLIFVASMSSLASANCYDEWVYFLNSHKPIYLVIFEELPSELDKDAPVPEYKVSAYESLQTLRQHKNLHIIDFRVWFEQGLTRLITCLTDDTCQERDPIPHRNRYFFRNFPFHVRNVMMFIFLPIITPPILLLIFAILLPAFSPEEQSLYDVVNRIMLVFGLAGVTWYFLVEWRRIMYRKYYFRQAMRLVVISILGTAFLLNAVLAEISTSLALISVLVLFSGLIYCIWALMFSNDWLRYAPRGAARRRRRISANRLMLQSQVQNFKPCVYTLRYAPSDVRVARQINRILQRAGHVRKQQDDEYYNADARYITRSKRITRDKTHEMTGQGNDIANYNFIVLSNRTPRELIDEAMAQDKQTIGIIVSSINWGVINRRVKALQLFDFRRRIHRDMREFGEFMGQPDNSTVTYSPFVTPTPFDTPVASPLITFLANIMRLIALILIIVALGYTVSGTTNVIGASTVYRGNPDEQITWYGVTRFTTYVLVAGGFAFGYNALANSLIVRRFSLGTFLALFAVFHALLLAGIVLVTVEEIVIEVFFIATYCIFGSIFTSVLVPFLGSLWFWLPKTVERKAKTDELNLGEFPLVTPIMRRRIIIASGFVSYLLVYFFIESWLYRITF